MKKPSIYIMASKKNGTLYVGVTSDLVKRVWEHREGVREGFSKKYDCKILVYYEFHETMALAIAREKQLKGGSRIQKLNLIMSMNADWNDLFVVIGTP